MTATDPQPAIPSPADEPMSADRRTLTIGVIAMVLLILVGVVSGALFARSACSDIAPGSIAMPVAATDASGLREVLPGLSSEERTSWQDDLEGLAGHLGQVSGVAATPGAERLAMTDVGPATLGRSVIQLGGGGGRVEQAVEVGSGTVVGSGAHLYTLALTNLLTGQVDALQPLDADLGGLTCVDTALVGSPLAFHLDASAGQLLLLRIDEDGDDAELELRDPVAGRFWGADLELPTAPAGLAGARLTASLGTEVVVAGTRTGPGETAPVLSAVARADGAARWQVTRDALLEAGVALPDDGPTRAEVHRVGSDLVLVGLRDVEGTGRADEEAEQDALAALRQLIVGIDAERGTVVFSADLDPAERIVAASTSGRTGTLVVLDAGQARSRVLEVDEAGARVVATSELRGTVLDDLDRTAAASRGAIGAAVLPWPGGVADLADGRRVVTTGASVVVLPPAGVAASASDVVEVGLPSTAVVEQDGVVSILLLGPDDDRIVVTFGG